LFVAEFRRCIIARQRYYFALSVVASPVSPDHFDAHIPQTPGNSDGFRFALADLEV
jgi:hypothetical protein